MVANSVVMLFALDREKWRGGGREGGRGGGGKTVELQDKVNGWRAEIITESQVEIQYTHLQLTFVQSSNNGLAMDGYLIG